MTIATDCLSCADERAAGAAFCEACGRPLTTPATAPEVTGETCPSCGEPGAVGEDGYCANCGMLAARPRDHLEVEDGGYAAVTDRGKRHHRNEDAMFLAVRAAGPGRAVEVDVVVCDGVSSSFDPDVASETAAETIGKLLATAEIDGVGEAIVQAGAAVAKLAGEGDPRRAASNPACTAVAAVVRDGGLGWAWVGDSRAYWLPAEGDVVALTEDDSWAGHVIRELGVDPQVAWNDPKAHAITAWLGADAGAVIPHTGTLHPQTPGHLILCSDGLWNYLTDPAEFAATVRKHLAQAATTADAARSLVAFANDSGGADNITVALIPVGR